MNALVRYAGIAAGLALWVGSGQRAWANLGILDDTFGQGGRVITQFSREGTQELNALTLQTDPQTGATKIIGAGFAALPTGLCAGGCFALARYDLKGNLDPSFGPQRDGKALTTFSVVRLEGTLASTDSAAAVAVDRKGRVVAAGSAFRQDGQSCRFAVARYQPNGLLDATFGSGGRVETNVNSACDQASAVVVQTLRGPLLTLISKVVAAGSSGDPGTPATASVGTHFTLVRYDEAGKLDGSFGGGGIVRSGHFSLRRLFGAYTSSFDRIAALSLHNGGLVAAGTAEFHAGDLPLGGISTIALARYQADGAPDLAFGSGGKVVTELPGPAKVSALKVQSDGMLVVTGTYTQTNGDPVVYTARYDATGHLDARFGAGGVATLNLSVASPGKRGLESAGGLAIDAAGGLVMAGAVEAPGLFQTVHQFALARFTSGGLLDGSFGSDGVVRTWMPVDPSPLLSPLGGGAHALVQQPDGDLVAGGFALDGVASSDWALARYR